MSTFFRDHGAALTTLALWPPFTMGVASLLCRRKTATKTATSASAGVTLRPYRRPSGVEIVVVESESDWERVWAKMGAGMKEAPVIGFDCEWVSAGSAGSSAEGSADAGSGEVAGGKSDSAAFDHPSQPGKVSLLQISTASGLCILVRLLKLADDYDDTDVNDENAVLEKQIPETLRTILREKNVLKVGLGTKEDSARLLKDHGIEVRGCVDLRHVVTKCSGKDLQDGGSVGLKTLAEVVLHQTLAEKQSSHKTRRSNWEADSLSADQVQYAANKALVALDIFRESTLSKMRGSRCYCGFCSGSIKLTPDFWRNAASLCDGFADVVYQVPSSPSNARSERGAGKVPSPKPILDRSLRPSVQHDASFRPPTNEDDSLRPFADNDRSLPPSKDVEESVRSSATIKGSPKAGDESFERAANVGGSVEKMFEVTKSKSVVSEKCRLQMPDGTFLCDCESSKAMWYVENGFGELLPSSSTSPSLSSSIRDFLRLSFDPVGEAFGEDGVFYGKGDGIRCVVCGVNDNYCLRKDIIPKVYRQHFPDFMKGDSSSQDILLMCIKCYRENIDLDKEFGDDLAKSCNALPVGSAMESSHGSAKQAAKIVTWMKSAYNGSLLEFERLWRQNFLEKMGPKYLPAFWSLDLTSSSSSKNDGNSAVVRLTISNESSGAEPINPDQPEDVKLKKTMQSRNQMGGKRDALKKKGGAIVNYLSYLDPVVMGIPSFIVSRVLDHTARLRMESPQNSWHNQISNFANQPVFSRRELHSLKPEVKSVSMNLNSMDSMGAVWTGGTWTVLGSLGDRVKERREERPFEMAARHQIEAVLGLWTAGLSVATQHIFSMNLLTTRHLATASNVIKPDVRPCSTSQADDKEEFVPTLPTFGYSLDSIVSLWTCGIWSLTKSLISRESQLETTTHSADGIKPFTAFSHQVFATLKHLDPLLCLWSFGGWAIVQSLFGHSDHSMQKYDSTSESIKSAEPTPHELLTTEFVESNALDPIEMNNPLEVNQLFLSLWSAGLVSRDSWTMLKCLMNFKKSPARMEIEDVHQSQDEQMTDSDSVDTSPRLMQSLSVPVVIATQVAQSASHIVQESVHVFHPWSFGVLSLISVLFDRCNHRITDLLSLENLETHAETKKIESLDNSVEPAANFDVSKENLHEVFLSVWTLGLWSILKSISHPFFQGKASDKIVATKSGEEEEPSKGHSMPEDEITETTMTQEVRTKSNIQNQLPSFPVLHSSKTMLKMCKSAVAFTEMNLLSIWTFGIWELIQILIGHNTTTMSKIADYKNVEDENLQKRISKDNQKLSPDPIISFKPDESFYVIWSLGLWPAFRFALQSLSGFVEAGSKANIPQKMLPLNEEKQSGVSLKQEVKREMEISSDTGLCMETGEGGEKSDNATVKDKLKDESHYDLPVSFPINQSPSGEQTMFVDQRGNIEDEYEMNEAFINNVDGKDHSSFTEKSAELRQSIESDISSSINPHEVILCNLNHAFATWSFGIWTILKVMTEYSKFSIESLHSDSLNSLPQSLPGRMNDNALLEDGHLKEKDIESLETRTSHTTLPSEIFYALWSLGIWQVFGNMRRSLAQMLQARKETMSLQEKPEATTESEFYYKQVKETSHSKAAEGKSGQPAMADDEMETSVYDGSITDKEQQNASYHEQISSLATIESPSNDSELQDGAKASIECGDEVEMDKTNQIGMAESKWEARCEEDPDVEQGKATEMKSSRMISSNLESLLDAWSLGLWTVLKVIQGQSKLSIEQLHQDAETTSETMEISNAAKGEIIKLSSDDDDLFSNCFDYTEAFLFFISAGLVNYIDVPKEKVCDMLLHVKSLYSAGGMSPKPKAGKETRTDDAFKEDKSSEPDAALEAVVDSTTAGSSDNVEAKSGHQDDFKSQQDGPISSSIHQSSSTGETISVDHKRIIEGKLELTKTCKDTVDTKAYTSFSKTSPEVQQSLRSDISSPMKLHEAIPSNSDCTLAIWSFGIWTILKVIKEQSKFSTKDMQSDTLKMSESHFEGKNDESFSIDGDLVKKNIESFETTTTDLDETFYALWSLGLWQVFCSVKRSLTQTWPARKRAEVLQEIPERTSESECVYKLVEERTHSKATEGKSGQQAIAEDEVDTSEYNDSVADIAQQNTLQGSSKARIVEGFEVEVDKKNLLGMAESKLESGCEADPDLEKDKAMEMKPSGLILSNLESLVDTWSFGLWTILKVMQGQSKLSLEQLHQDADETSVSTEMSYAAESKMNKLSSDNDDLVPNCSDHTDAFLFLLSVGLINYIGVPKEKVCHMIRHVGSLCNVGGICQKQIVGEGKKNDEAVKKEKSTEPDVAIAAAAELSSFESSDDVEDHGMVHIHSVEREDIIGKTSKIASDSASKHSLGSKLTTSEIVKSHSQLAISLADVWTFGLWSMCKRLPHFSEGQPNVTELFLGFWSFGLLPAILSREAQDDSLVTSPAEYDSTELQHETVQVTKPDEGSTDITNDSFPGEGIGMAAFLLDIWSFGFLISLRNLLDGLHENRKMLEFLLNIWLFGVWPNAAEQKDQLLPEPKKSSEGVKPIHPSLSVSRQTIDNSESKVIHAYDALLGFMSMGLWIPARALLNFISISPIERSTMSNGYLNLTTTQRTLFSTLLNHWTIGVWSVLIAILNGSRTTISSLEAESRASNASVVPKQLKPHYDLTPNNQTLTNSEFNYPAEKQLLDVWTFGIYGLLRDLNVNSADKTGTMTSDNLQDVILSVWTFGFWNLLQNLRDGSESQNITSQDTQNKKAHEKSSFDSLLSMWTLGLWIHVKSIINRSKTGDDVMALKHWVSQRVYDDSQKTITTSTPSTSIIDEEEGVTMEHFREDCSVTPDSDSYVHLSGSGTESPQSAISGDYEFVKFDYEDLVKNFSGKVDLSTIQAVFDEAHGVEAIAHEILESMVDSEADSDSFVHCDEEGNEILDKATLQNVDEMSPSINKSSKHPVLKVISSPSIAMIKTDSPGASGSKSKNGLDAGNEFDDNSAPLTKAIQAVDVEDGERSISAESTFDQSSIEQSLKREKTQSSLSSVAVGSVLHSWEIDSTAYDENAADRIVRQKEAPKNVDRKGHSVDHNVAIESEKMNKERGDVLQISLNNKLSTSTPSRSEDISIEQSIAGNDVQSANSQQSSAMAASQTVAVETGAEINFYVSNVSQEVGGESKQMSSTIYKEREEGVFGTTATGSDTDDLSKRVISGKETSINLQDRYDFIQKHVSPQSIGFELPKSNNTTANASSIKKKIMTGVEEKDIGKGTEIVPKLLFNDSDDKVTKETQKSFFEDEKMEISTVIDHNFKSPEDFEINMDSLKSLTEVSQDEQSKKQTAYFGVSVPSKGILAEQSSLSMAEMESEMLKKHVEGDEGVEKENCLNDEHEGDSIDDYVDDNNDTDDDDDDDVDDDSEENQLEFSKILALAKKMDNTKVGNDEEWLSILAKKISKEDEGELQDSKVEEQSRDVFRDKDWDVCHDLRNTLTEYDMSSEAATSDTGSSKEEKAAFEEYDIISHSSSAISFTEQSSTKESSPVGEISEKVGETTADTNEAVDKFEELVTSPVLVRRMFTSSTQRLNESQAEVNVTLDSPSALRKKLSGSTTSLDSNTSSTTITKEFVTPSFVISHEDDNLEGSHLTRQELTQVTQSRILYRGKSPSQSRFSESSGSSEDLSGDKSSTPMAIAMPTNHSLDGALKQASEPVLDGSTFTSVLGSQTEFTDVQETSTGHSDSETSSTADQEEVWVTETSEMVTSFVTETVRRIKVDEHGNESVEETVRFLGPDGSEVNPDLATSLMRSPSFVEKN